MKNTAHNKHLFRRLRWEEISPKYLSGLVLAARDEDLFGQGLETPPNMSNKGDPTTFYTTTHLDGIVRTRIVARNDCILCGIKLLPIIFESFYTDSNKFYIVESLSDGDPVSSGQTIATLECSVTLLLTAERTLLNFLQKLSGIATQTATYAAKLAGTPARLLDTRKTTPGWRMLEKYAVATGGGWNHRLGLFDRIMLKDNHIAASIARGETLAELVKRVRSEGSDLLVEVEVDSPDQIASVLDANADVILLDNFPLAEIPPALAQIGDRAWTEISGGVTLDNIGDIARLGPDFISTGAITHHAPWVDIGLDWEM